MNKNMVFGILLLFLWMNSGMYAYNFWFRNATDHDIWIKASTTGETQETHDDQVIHPGETHKFWFGGKHMGECLKDVSVRDKIRLTTGKIPSPWELDWWTASWDDSMFHKGATKVYADAYGITYTYRLCGDRHLKIEFFPEKSRAIIKNYFLKFDE